MRKTVHGPALILVAEDNPADVFLVRQALSNCNILFDLNVVTDGEQAVSFLRKLADDPVQRCPDVLLLDMNLPKQNGVEVLKSLRASPRCAKIPVIFLASSIDPKVYPAAADDPAIRYFQKPGNLDDFMKLGDLVKETIEKSG